MATGDKYVMNGVWLTCDKGVAPSRFNVTPKPVQLYDEHFANELDKVPMVNILPFGVCSVTRTPCVPAPVMWERVMEDGLTVMGARPLLDTSKCMCGVGGKMAIHFTKADATAAVELDQQLDQVDEAADAVEEASGWAFWGGLAMGIGGAIMVATGVGAPLGAAMITGAGYLMTASTIAGTAAVAVKGATKFARDPSKEVGLSIVGEVAWEAAKNYIMNKLGGKLIGKLAGSKLGQRIANSSFARKMEDRFANAFARNRNAKPTCVGEPVDVATGKVINKGIDFELGGPLPLVWSRVWYSTSAHEGALGHGWHHSFDEELYADEEVILLRLPDGRYTGTEPLPVGAVVYIREERLTLTHTSAGYAYVDANGLIHEFSYFAATDSYKLTRLSRRAGEGTITLDYSAQGHLALITDSSGRALRVESDAAGRLLSIFAPHPTEARGQVALVRYTYSRQGHLTKATDALGYAWQFRYEGPLLVQATYKNGLGFYYAYDGPDQRARCLRTWGDEGLYACELRYDLEQHQTTVTDSVGAQRVYQYDPELGAVTGFFDARGGATSLEYNEYGELLSLTNPLGYETRFEYDARGNCTATTLPDGATLHRTFDDYDQLVQAVDTVGGQWQWQYNTQGQLLQCLDPAQQALHYTYHAGRLTSITDVAIDYTLTLAYDQAGNVAELRGSDQRVSRRLYDGWGRVFKSTDPQGTVQWREYDLLSRPVKVHEPDGNVLHFAYDALGNVVYAKDRQREVRYAYRGLGRLIRRVEAGTAVEFLYDTEERLRAVVNEHGLTYRYELDAEGSIVTETGFDGLARSYQRDAGGRVTEVLLPTQERIRHEYDPAGRLTAVTYGDGSRETYRYRTDGALMQADNDTTSVQFTRDVLGRVLQEAQGAHTVTSDYDLRGFRLGLTTSLGGEVRYERNARGQVERLQSAGWQAWFERDAQGQETHRTLPGGVHTRWRRDGLGRPTEQRISRQVGHAERTRVYSWQASDQLAHIQDSRSGLTRFEHDAWGNLTTTTFGDGSQQFRLPDAVGNLFDALPSRPAQRYGPAGQLLADANCTYAYDLLGNLVRKTTRQGEEWRYEWNAVGQLKAVIRPDGVAVQFGYDALGRRVYKSCQGKTTRWLWDDNVPLHEWTEYAAGTPAEELVTWLFAEDSLTPVGKLQGAQRYSFIPDHLGTPLEVRDGRGEPLWAGELDSYGRVRGRTPGLTPCPFRYQGQYEDAETGLYYNRFRYYDPSTGVYISQDPSGLQGGPRLYSYVANPATYIDPYGLFPGPGFFSDLKWTGMGHHTVPRAHAAAHNLPKLASRHDAPTWYPQQADVPGSSQIHHDLHLALENNGVPFDPRRGVNPTSQADLLTKARTAYQGFDQKGILRIPSSGEVVADNVTVLEAMEKALEWNKNQCP